MADARDIDEEQARAMAAEDWLAIPEGHACPVCAARLEEWRKRRGT